MHNKYSLLAVDFNPFEGNEIEKVIITNEPQREVWLSCVIGGDEASLAYNESVSLEFKGDFNFPAFEKAINDLIVRHEGLRAVISRNGENLIIYKECLCDIYTEDLSGADIANWQLQIKDFFHKEMEKPFDLYNGPLFRFFVHTLRDDLHYFTIIIHHLIGDGWSIGVILEDLSSLYNAHLAGEKSNLVKAEQISDYAKEQILFSKSEAYQSTIDFWTNTYKDVVPILNLPLDFVRPAVRTYSGKRNDYTLTEDILVGIKQLAAKTHSSLVVTLIAAFEVLLYHRTGQTDIVVGLPSAGQLATGYLGLVGHCVNLLPLLSKIDPDQSFVDYLIKRRSEIYDAYDYQRLTFSELIRRLNIKRDKSRVPLVPIVFNVDMGMDEKVKFNGLKHRLISNPRISQTFDITLNVNGSKNALVFEWAYNTQLFTSDTIDLMMLEFESLLKTVTSLPGVAVRDAIVYDIPFPQRSASEGDFLKNKTIIELFSDQVNKNPKNVAVTLSGKKITYQELDATSNQLSNYLISKGVNKGDLIPVCINRSLEMIVGILGIIKAGAAYVPIDPNYPVKRISYILNELKSKFVISNLKSSKDLPGNLILLDKDLDQIKKETTAPPESNVQINDLLYIIYTSGSTGKPKGVMIEHQSLASYITAQTEYFGITDQENILQFSNYCFDASVEQIFLALLNGACLVLMPEALLTDITSFSAFLNEEHISHLHATPGFLENLGATDHYPHLKRIVSAGEACKKELVKKWIQKVSFYNKYGPTEGTISVLEYLCPTNGIDDLKILPIGKAIKNNSVYILNEKLQPAATGEIYIGGIQVARGYFNQPELTAKSFIINPFEAGERLYKTGDLAKWGANENIEFLGRIDDQVKIRGYRIEIGEIENTLRESQDVKQCVVTTLDDEAAGKRLVAYVVTDDNFNKESIRQNLLLKLPEYMVPRTIIKIDHIPLTPNGKVDKKALLQIQDLTESEKTVFIPPQTKEQQMIADVWATNLGLKEISITDDFFELGGHSLIAVKVMSIIEKMTGKRLPLATLFENSTVERLAKLIGANDQEIKWNSLVPIKTAGTKKPVYLIHGGGLNTLVFKSMSTYMDPDQPVYALQALGLNGKTTLYFSIEEIAAKYISEILQVDPEGPYLIAGYSLGGKIAYEMARQLIASGKEVKMLGIFDTYAASSSRGLKKLMRKLMRQFNKVPFFYEQFTKRPKAAFSYQCILAKKKFNRLIGKSREPDTEVFTYDSEILRSYEEAYRNYKLSPLNMNIDLFRVKDRIYYLDDMVFLGWKPYGLKGIEVHPIPGDHKTFLFPPNDKELAVILQRVIDSKIQ